MYTEDDTSMLAKAFANGLAEATLREDLTFAAEGVKKASLSADERFTA
ncbi:MAG: hypothetical protein ACREVY_13005 [Gammaproteobacteria bacterium]